MLLLLQIHRRMTVRELAKRLEVSVRTVSRDMEALHTAGIPITAERGAAGGWFLLDGYRMNLTGSNEPEVQALFVPGPSPLLKMSKSQSEYKAFATFSPLIKLEKLAC
jgi:predicted DNA-binding transcriptional regulator YafY